MANEDQVFAESEIERRLGEVERKTNALYSAGLELLVQSGYVQFDGVPMRWDTNGMQIKSTAGVDTAAVYWVPALQTDPGSSYPFAAIEGGAATTFPALQLTAEGSATFSAQAGTRMFNVGGGIATAFLNVTNGSLTGSASLNATTGQITFSLASGVYFQISGASADPSTLADGQIWYRADTGKLYARINGATVELGGGGGGMSLIVKEADESLTSNATEQDDNDLLFAVAANEVWQFEGVLFVTSHNTPDFKMRFAGPAASVGSWSAVLNATTAIDEATAALGTSVTIAWPGAQTNMIRFWGGIKNGANVGSLKLQWSQGTSDGNATAVLAGSYIKYQLES